VGVTVGELKVEFDAETKRLNSGLKTLDKKLNRFEKKATRATAAATRGFAKMRAGLAKIGPLVAGLAAALGPAFLLRGVKNAAAFGDNIAKTADRIGIGTESLQELGFAATQSGVDLSVLQSSLGAFSKRLGEARAGTGALITQLKKSNPELLENLQSATSLGGGLDLLADSISGMDSELDQAALASAAFSRAGLAMVNLLRKGSDGMRQMRAQARDLGLVLDDHLIRKSEVVTDQFDILNRQLGTTFRQILIDLGPLVVGVSRRIGTFAQNVGFLVAKFREIENISTGQIQAETIDLTHDLIELRSQLEKAQELVGDSSVNAWLENISSAGGTAEERVAAIAAAIDTVQAKLDRGEAELERRRKAKAGSTGDEGEGEVNIDADALLAQQKALADAQKAGLGEVLALQQQLRNERLAALDPLLGEIDALDQQIARQQTLVVAEGDASERRQENLDNLRADRKALQTELEDATLAQVGLQEQLGLALDQVAEKDGERVALILQALRARQAEGLGIAQNAEDLKQAILDIRDLKGAGEGDEDEPSGADKLGESIAGSVSRGALRGLESAFSGEGIDFAESFGDIFGDIFLDSMQDVLSELQDSLSDMISEFAEGLGGGPGLSAAIGAGIGIAGQLVARQVAGTEVKQQRSRTQSAVTGSQEIRGVVAGPTSIPIAQVGNAIRDAGQLQLDESKKQTTLLEMINSKLGGLGGGGGGGLGLDLTASQVLGG
jgi:hypothetical protein